MTAETTADVLFHEFASVFPLIQKDSAEFQSLVADIRANGQQQEIILHPDGSILDGRNRYLACRVAGVEPRFKTYSGDLSSGVLIRFVVSLNLHRRHLSSDQKAAIAVEAYAIVERLEQEAKERQKASGGDQKSSDMQKSVRQTFDEPIDENAGRTTEQLAELFDTNRQYVSEMKKLKKDDPESFEAVKSGEKKLTDHRKQERKRKNQEKQDEAKKVAAQQIERPWLLTAQQDVVACSALITDPPYGILDEPWEPAKLEDFTREWATRWAACGADLLAVFFSQRHLWDGRRWFDESFEGYDFQQLLVWHYPNNKSPQNRLGFKQTWEPVYLYRRAGCDRQIKPDGAAWGDGLNDFDCHVAAVPQSNFNDANEKVHPAQKPVQVMRWLVGALTGPNELICDPFSGSGTTGIAAVQLGRRFHGIEISDEYRERAEGRIAAYGNPGV